MTSMLAYSQEVYSIGKTIPYVGSRYMKVQYILHENSHSKKEPTFPMPRPNN